MDRDRYQRIRALYVGASDRPAPDRAGWLDDACGDDRALREEVERLLAAAPPDTDDFAAPVEAFAADIAETSSASTPDRSAERASRSPSRPVVIVVAVLLIAGGGLAYLALRSKPPQPTPPRTAPPPDALPIVADARKATPRDLGSLVAALGEALIKVRQTALANEALVLVNTIDTHNDGAPPLGPTILAFARRAQATQLGDNGAESARRGLWIALKNVYAALGETNDAERCAQLAARFRE